jgi:hypothetical protein
MAKETNPRSEAADAVTPATADQPKPRRTRGSTDRRRADPSARPTAEGPADLTAPQSTTPHTMASQSMTSEPSEEDIRRRAYHRYLERGGGHGMDFQDWLDAERELKKQS